MENDETKVGTTFRNFDEVQNAVTKFNCNHNSSAQNCHQFLGTKPVIESENEKVN